MSWLTDLFARKPGGTAFGNLFRSAASFLTDGKLGGGSMMISQQEYDLKNLSDDLYGRKYGVTKQGIKIPGITPDPSIMTADQYASYVAQQNANGASIVSPTAVLKPYIPWIAAGLGLLALPKILKGFGLWR